MGKIHFEKQIIPKTVFARTYLMLNVILKLDGKVVDPDLAGKSKGRIPEILRSTYWRAIRKLVIPRSAILVRLSGLHFRIEDATDYVFAREFRANMVLHYHSWKIAKSGIRNEESFALIECDRQVFRELFDRFWFSLGYERRFEAFIMKRESVLRVDNWSGRAETQRKPSELIRMSQVIVDNCHNGLHFSVLANSRYSKLLSEIL